MPLFEELIRGIAEVLYCSLARGGVLAIFYSNTTPTQGVLEGASSQGLGRFVAPSCWLRFQVGGVFTNDNYRLSTAVTAVLQRSGHSPPF